MLRWEFGLVYVPCRSVERTPSFDETSTERKKHFTADIIESVFDVTGWAFEAPSNSITVPWHTELFPGFMPMLFKSLITGVHVTLIIGGGYLKCKIL